MNISPRAQMTRTQNWRPSVSVPPAHWKNPAMEKRANGSESPIFNADGSVVLHKQYLEQKHTIDARLAEQRAQIAQGALNSNG